ncbi:hypothetical protein V8C26DRAFT_386001 [Trichoderma gracile]
MLILVCMYLLYVLVSGFRTLDVSVGPGNQSRRARLGLISSQGLVLVMSDEEHYHFVMPRGTEARSDLVEKKLHTDAMRHTTEPS